MRFSAESGVGDIFGKFVDDEDYNDDEDEVRCGCGEQNAYIVPNIYVLKAITGLKCSLLPIEWKLVPGLRYPMTLMQTDIIYILYIGPATLCCYSN